MDAEFVVESTPRTRVYRWTVSAVTGAPVGVSKPMVVVNGQSPGPIIQANYNDRILVYLTNGLAREGTSIHWHGLPQNGTNHYDGASGITQCAIPPGETLLYNFTLGGWVGTTWWHGHTDMQHTDGLFGPLVSHSPFEDMPPYETEHVLTLADVYNVPAAGLVDEYLNSNPTETVPEPVPDAASINGHGQFDACVNGDGTSCDGGARSYFNLTIERGERTRLRLINAASFAPLHFSIAGHVLTVIEADGTRVSPVRVGGLVIEAAQRYSVLANPDKAYWIRVRIEKGMFAYENPHMQPEALGVLRYAGADPYAMPGERPRPRTLSRDPLPDLDERTLIPLPPIRAPSWNEDESSPHGDIYTIPFIFSIQRTHQQNWRAFVNNTSWELLGGGRASGVVGTAQHAGVTTGSTQDGEEEGEGKEMDQLIASVGGVGVVDFVINNLDDGDHPFHLHGYKPWIMGVGRGRFRAKKDYLNETNPMRRDTFLVPARSWAVVRIVTDNPGYWAFHCHIAWHMASGGLFQVAVQPARVAEVALPADMLRHCASWLGEEDGGGR
ncbi:multi-copper oxidase [Mycena epipterygia]|nr:multi-copper oxidase [Mycena epipterygia]